MPTRREFLQHTSAIAALTAASRGNLSALAQDAQRPAPQSPPSQPDEMTRTINAQPQRYPPIDFGPLPTVLPPETKALAGPNSLNAHAVKHGLIAGAAVPVRPLMNDPVLQELVAEQYGILVPENELKPRGLRPSPTTYDFSVSDQLFDFAEKHKMLVRGHTLVWHGSVPDWVRTNAAQLNLRDVMVDHIRTVMSRYKGRVQSWDVVNEAIQPTDGEPNGMRKTVWYKAMGMEYIDLAYRSAREADPHAKLSYNDYGVEYDNEEQAERRRDVLALLRRMQQNKVPIDAVGIQSHIKAVSPSTIGKGLTDYMDAIRGMGLEIYLTELDVNDDDVQSNDIAERDRAVADTYRHFLDLALANPAVKLMLTWGVSDRMTWLNGGPTHHQKQPNRGQRALPFDPQYRPTPAFFAIRDSIDARPRT